MVFEEIDPITSDVISKVKTVVRVTPMEESASVSLSVKVAMSSHTFIYSGLSVIWKYCIIRLVDTTEEKEAVF